MSWEDVGVIKASPRRLQIMKSLVMQAMTPKELSQQLGVHMSQVTRSLKELEERDLVRCLTPQLRKGKLYGITIKGNQIMNKLTEAQNIGSQS